MGLPRLLLLCGLMCTSNAGIFKDAQNFGQEFIKVEKDFFHDVGKATGLDKLGSGLGGGLGGFGGGFDKLKKLTKGSDEDCKVIWEEHQQPHCSTEYEKICHDEPARSSAVQSTINNAVQSTRSSATLSTQLLVFKRTSKNADNGRRMNVLL